MDKDLVLHQAVLKGGYPNRWGAKIELEHKWNLQLLDQLLAEYTDRDIIEWIKYGWPSGCLPSLTQPGHAKDNHTGANQYPEALHKYIQKEAKHGAIMGPYDKIPFTTRSKVGISPLSTRPKKESLDRRVILDFSFPPGSSVNDGMIKDNYLGFQASMKFPKIDELAVRIYQLGKNCLLFKIDLSRYFRQLPLDPGDYSLIGYIINGKFYFDKVLPMGMRSAPYITQRVTNAIAYIHRQMTYFILNYVDDFVGAETRDSAGEAYRFLTNLLRDLRIDTSPEKMVPPTTRLEFLGITFNTNTMTMEISQDKMHTIKLELDSWLLKTSSTRRELESLIGKLQFLAKCVRAGRIFISRLIQWLKGMNRTCKYTIPQEAKNSPVWAEVV